MLCPGRGRRVAGTDVGQSYCWRTDGAGHSRLLPCSCVHRGVETALGPTVPVPGAFVPVANEAGDLVYARLPAGLVVLATRVRRGSRVYPMVRQLLEVSPRAGVGRPCTVRRKAIDAVSAKPTQPHQRKAQLKSR
jgi:hypothetical protein